MSDPLRYPVPFRVLLADLTRPILENRRADIAAVYRKFVARMDPAPEYRGLQNLPAHPRFILAANHYQRPGLWIAHVASVLAAAMTSQYSTNPPIRWVVTANWPRWRLGPVTVPSPGDILLPRVAHAAWCYAIPFAGTNPATTAKSLRRLLKDAGTLACPVGLFPEGARATAGRLEMPLPGIGRFLSLMAARGWPVVPAGISERGRFVVQFGCPLNTRDLSASPDAGMLVMQHIAKLTTP